MFLIFSKYLEITNHWEILYLDQFMEYTGLLTTGSFIVLEQK